MSGQWRTTAEAAAAGGFRTDPFRGLMRDARQAGIDLQAPREAWPDARTPLYDAARLDKWLANRPRGKRRNVVTAVATSTAPDVDELAEAFAEGRGPVQWTGRIDIAQAGTVTLTVTLNGAPVPDEVRDRVVGLAASLLDLTDGPAPA